MSSDESRQTPRLSAVELVAYSLPSAPVSMLMMMLIVYLAPFYAAEMGIELAAVGAIFAIARLWDAVLDPVVGNLSDLTKSRFGRRKPWIAVGTPFLMIAIWLFFRPPSGASMTYLAVVAVFFYVTMTLVQIPYLSWGAELSRDYQQRIRINSYREAGTMIGIIIVAVIPLFFLDGANSTVSDIVEVFTWVVLILLPLTVIPSLAKAPIAPPLDTKQLTLLKALYALRVNRPFLRLMVASLAIWIGGQIYNSTSLFLITSALGFAPATILWLILVQFTIGLVSLPLVLRLGRRVGKHRALLFGGLTFFLVLPLLLLVEPGNLTQVFIVYALKGAFTAAIWVLPPALVADSIEYGVLKGTGDDSGLYMSLYFFIQKLAASLGVGIALPIAAWLGFDPQVADSDLAGLKFVSVILPAIIALPAVFLLFNYPIDEERHREIREELARRGIQTST